MAEPLKILQIVPSIALVYGGPSQMVRGLSAALARQGATVTVLTTDANGDQGQPPLEVPLGQPVATEGYQVVYFRRFPFERYKFSLPLLAWLYRHGGDYDLAHIHALFSPVSSGAAAVARTRGLPYILRPLGTLDPADLAKKRRLKQLYTAALEGANLRGAAALHFTSQEEARVSKRFGSSSQELILPLGVTPLAGKSAGQSVRQRYGIAAETPILLFMSRLDPKKGLDLLLPVLEELAQTLPFHFMLSGGNPQDSGYVEGVRRRIEGSILGERTTITGFVTGNQKAEILAAADLFVLPSYYENFGIAVAEAMAAGKPVVISNRVHIWEDIQGSGSGWVTDCDRNTLAQALKEALTQPQERRRRGEQGRQFSRENYSWDRIAQETVAAYRQLLNR